jgi:hypothetical protein
MQRRYHAPLEVPRDEPRTKTGHRKIGERTSLVGPVHREEAMAIERTMQRSRFGAEGSAPLPLAVRFS